MLWGHEVKIGEYGQVWGKEYGGAEFIAFSVREGRDLGKPGRNFLFYLSPPRNYWEISGDVESGGPELEPTAGNQFPLAQKHHM